MKKYLLLILSILLLSGCQNNDYELEFDMAMNCYKKVYEFKDGTRVYSAYSEITYKTEKNEISIKEAIDRKLIDLKDLEGRPEFKIVTDNTDVSFCVGS